MKRLRLIFLVFAVALFVACFAFGQGGIAQKGVPAFAKSQAIVNVRGAAAQNQIGKPVEIEGFYYDGSIPMLIDDFQRVTVNMPIPSDSYVPLVGTLPKGLQNGARIRMRQGILDRPSAKDPAYVRGEPTVLRLGANVTYAMLRPTSYQVLTQPVLTYTIQPGIVRLTNRYAVLISGGINAANNHLRYWNDLKAMYVILLNNGYPSGNIVVLYADGVARDASMPVNYSATAANISTVFNLLAGRMTSSDRLYIFTTNHGGSNVLCLWNSTSISTTAFGTEVNKITNYDRILITMEQCFSGSFIPSLTAARRTVMTACSATESSWARAGLVYDEFTFWYFAALTGSKPDGTGAVNADTNGDGKISIVEAYNFARSHDGASETPYFEDDGVAPGHSGAMPAGGDGVQSATIFVR